MTLRHALAKLHALIRKEHLDCELDDEIHAHLELAEHDALSRGLSPQAARQEARRHFGAIEQMKEDHRDRRGIQWIETILRDFRHGVASLRRAFTMTAVIVCILALGIGGAVAMFGVVDAVLLKPLPFSEPDRIVRLWEAPRPGVVNETTVPQFLAWHDASSQVFDELVAESPVMSALNDNSGATRVAGKLVTAAYFKVFTAQVALGRTFTPEEDQPGATSVVVLSHAAWEIYFGADPNILHRRILLDGEPSQVIGVLEPGVFDRDQIQFWKPLLFTAVQKSNDNHWLTVYGRLRRGLSLTQARQRMSAIYTVLAKSQHVGDRGGSIAIESLARLLVGPHLQRSIAIAFGAVFLVLLIACANVANLLFAQAATRRTELAIRASLGAGRSRLILQLLTECLALCVVGGAAGIAVAYGLIRLSTPLLAQSLPFTAAVNLNPDVLLFATALVLGVVLLAGTIPALQASSDGLTDGLRQSARGSSRTQVRMRRTIVSMELAFSFVLVCGALLLIRSLFKLQQVDTGVRIDNVITTSIDLPLNAYPTPQKAALFYEALTQRLHSIPGIKKVGLSTTLPLQWISNGEAIQTPGDEKLIRVRLKRVDSGYFSTFDIPVLAGRGITDQDRAGSPRVVVINQALAKRLAAEAGIQNPVGRVVQLSTVTYQKELQSPFQIAGVIRSERTASPGDPDPPVAYVPLAQNPVQSIELSVQAERKTDALLATIRAAVHTIDPNLPIGSSVTMQQVLERTLLPVSQPAWLIGGFASIALLLAAIGLYGLMSHSVTLRRREIAIRLALGAHSRDILSDISRDALLMLLPGAAFGLVGAFAVTRIMRSLLFEVSPLDPVALATACLSLAMIGLLAGFLPANRAVHIDPAVTLRDIG
jgi:predicted permease